MYQGKCIEWGIWAPGHDLAGQASIRLIQHNYTSDQFTDLIGELMAVQNHLRTKTLERGAPKWQVKTG